MYNLDYDIAAVIVLLIELVYVRIQYEHDKYSNRLFIMILHASFLYSLVDIVGSLVLGPWAKSVSVGFSRFVCSLFYSVNAFVFLVFYRYIVEYLGDKRDKTVGYFVRTYFPFVFIIECLIANRYANIFFSEGKYGHYSYGSLMLIVYLYPIYYFILTIVTLVRNKKNITGKQVFSVVFYMAITVASSVIQIVLPDAMVLSFGYAISLLVMIWTLETPDYRRLIQANETLDVLRDELEHQDAYNRLFIEEMSNEICTPVNKLIEKNEELLVNPLNEKQREVCDYIDGYGRQVRASVNNTMEFVSHGDIHRNVDIREYSIGKIVQEAIKVIKPAAEDKSDTLTVEMNSDMPDTLVGPELLIKQVMINLLTDAIKYTDGGLISLSVDYRGRTSDNLNLIISVEDTGVGMKRDMVKKLLQFNTNGRNWKKEIFDSGNFRVRITKKMIEQMNGKLNIDSAFGKGSVFTAVIPQGIKE